MRRPQAQRPRPAVGSRPRRRLVRVRPLGRLSINRMIPNMLTLAALCAGMTAIRLGVTERWEPAVLAILIAAVLDGLDGRVARLLKASTAFGAELDSLSDFVCFGVAPAILVYLWTLASLKSLGWAVALSFGACAALRLARFNTQYNIGEPPAYAQRYFTGVPAPAAAGLALMPLAAWFETGWDGFRAPVLSVLTTGGVAALMVSRVPTFSLKKLHVAHEYVAPLLAATALLAAFLTTEPWITLLALGLAYAGSLPFSIRAYAADRRRVAEPKAVSGPVTLREIRETPPSGGR